MNSNKTKKCLSCLPTNKKIANTTKKRANWKTRRGLTSIFPNDKMPDLNNPKERKEKSPTNANQQIKIDLGKNMANRYVVYYAANECPMEECANCNVLDANNAYGDFKNQGLTCLNSEGQGVLKIKCPRPYHEENRTYLPHVHFIISDEDNKGWIPKLKTQTVVCQLKYEEIKYVVESGCAMIINALPFEYYVKSRIPNSIPLDHNLVLEKLSKKEVVEYIKVMLAHYPSIHKQVEERKMDLMDIPIISYCYHTKCEADSDLQMKLNKIGFTNVKLYPGGIKEWNRKNK